MSCRTILFFINEFCLILLFKSNQIRSKQSKTKQRKLDVKLDQGINRLPFLGRWDVSRATPACEKIPIIFHRFFLDVDADVSSCCGPPPACAFRTRRRLRGMSHKRMVPSRPVPLYSTLSHDPQADDPRHHLPPVIIMDGLLGRIRAGEDVPVGVETVLRWCWTVTGGRRLAHVVRRIIR